MTVLAFGEELTEALAHMGFVAHRSERPYANKPAKFHGFRRIDLLRYDISLESGSGRLAFFVRESEDDVTLVSVTCAYQHHALQNLLAPIGLATGQYYVGLDAVVRETDRTFFRNASPSTARRLRTRSDVVPAVTYYLDAVRRFSLPKFHRLDTDDGLIAFLDKPSAGTDDMLRLVNLGAFLLLTRRLFEFETLMASLANGRPAGAGLMLTNPSADLFEIAQERLNHTVARSLALNYLRRIHAGFIAEAS